MLSLYLNTAKNYLMDPVARNTGYAKLSTMPVLAVQSKPQVTVYFVDDDLAPVEMDNWIWRIAIGGKKDPACMANMGVDPQPGGQQAVARIFTLDLTSANWDTPRFLGSASSRKSSCETWLEIWAEYPRGDQDPLLETFLLTKVRILNSVTEFA